MDAHQRTVTTIKGLAMDAVQAANSGHPGMPMGAADMGVVLWGRFLKHDPSDPTWFDRDRFILSAGHGSMLIYSLLHLSGYDLSLDDLKAFRQWGSRTPGHPEHGHTAGVETTTGPLGQGFATGVGMAIAERWMRETWGADVCDHWTYGIVSDGDLMEGISYEAASLAGHLGLGRIVYLYDDNEISIDGGTDLSFTEDRTARFEAAGWHVEAVDGHDAAAITKAVEAARAETGRPSLIRCRTVIGQGSAKEGTSATHGAPLGAEDVAATKTRIGLDPAVDFFVDPEATAYLRDHDGAAARAAWEARVAARDDADALHAAIAGDLSAALDDVDWPAFEVGSKLATRKASAACLKAIVKAIPQVVGGSADLSGSNGVAIGAASVTPTDFTGGSLHFGVREHAMAAACNGMALHGGVVPYAATFLIFHDYMRPSVRLSCLMGQRVVYVYTHDSIFLGEDGPTHQPVETLNALRTVPGMHVFRPGDAAETAVAWKQALLRRDGPTALVLTRQGLPILDRDVLGSADRAADGAYVLRDTDTVADVVLVATGSEVPLALDAAEVLADRGIAARVVSAPCMERFDALDHADREAVLPVGVPRVTIEAGITAGWKHVAGDDGACIGIDRFGASAPASELAKQFGFTVDNVVATVERVLAR